MSKLIISGNPACFFVILVLSTGKPPKISCSSLMTRALTHLIHCAICARSFTLGAMVPRSWSCVVSDLPEAAREYLLQLHDADLASTTIEKHYAMLNMLFVTMRTAATL
ncbi:hypothetical protein PSJ60_23680 [Escherichia coli]|uniref:hypothetical protein n=1 Tax=Escherichia coli TaxID=562 RepID=UPI0023585D19|nr:hypothetical protein [Escherichia coli]MDC9067827.1 hypothetical protein [Escherichia coli]